VPGPHPWAGAGVELAGRDQGGQGDLLRGGKRLPRKRLAAKQPPPTLLQVQPASALGDEHLADARVVGQPGTGRVPVVAGQVIGDHHDGPVGVGGLDRGQQVLVAGRVAGRGGQGDRLPIADAQRPLHPGPLRPAAVVQWSFDPVAVGGPARRGWEAAGDHRAQLIGADHGRRLGRVGVAGDDLRSLGTKSVPLCVIPEGAGTVNPYERSSPGWSPFPPYRRAAVSPPTGSGWSARSVARTNDLGAVKG
jgi:hypothetical protein